MLTQGKAKGKGKSKGPQNSYPTKPKKPQPYKKEHSAKDGQCHHCKEKGHWKRNCLVYLAELMKKKKKAGGENVASTSSGLGYEAHVKRHTPDKLQQRSIKCIFVGYPKETIGYYFYYPPKNKIVVERYADFLETDFILQKESGRIVELEDEDILPLSDPEFKKWLVAMNAEIQSMYDNKVWRLVVLPPNAKVVKCKWIYKKKTDMDGKVHIYKARLVAKGCTQTYGVDYEETFSPVADIRAIRILIAIAAYYDYEIWQMDVKIAFFNGFLEEEIYMEQLKGNDIPSLQEVKTYLGKCFSMKELGETTFILGIKIYRDRSKRLIGLSQNAYLDKILKRYRMDNSKRGSIPM
nr:hypothetical protein [Tanacetum cinerariifolium]